MDFSDSLAILCVEYQKFCNKRKAQGKDEISFMKYALGQY